MLKNKKIMAVLLLVITLISNCSTLVHAVEINSANLTTIQNSDSHIQFKFDSVWGNVRTNYIGYQANGKTYPAYCISHGYPGVDEVGDYTVSIDKVLDDVRIWRTIINGFPYKSASELGVECDLDAYVATKQSIYCIILDRDVSSLYRGRDARGDKIVNAMKKMVNEGRYGIATPQNGAISAVKSGNLYKEGDYYIQKYNVNSAVQIGSYSITSISNLPKGSIITNKNGSQTTSFNGNESFYVKIPKSALNSNIDATINIQAKCKTYPVFFGKTPNSGWQNYAVTYDTYGDFINSINLNINVFKSGINIIKKDEDTGNRLSGVTYNAKYSDGTNIGNYTTDKNGKITINNLRQGKIILTEVSTRDEYVLDTTPVEVDLEYEQIKTVELTNEKIKGQIKVIKTSEDDNFINGKLAGSQIENVKFEVYDSNNNLVDEITTSADGTAITKLLDKGCYYIKEVESGEWYLLNENTFTAEIKENQEIINVEITNKSEKPSVDIEKTGLIQTTANEEIKYDFVIKNTGNVPLSNFTWFDYLPTDYVRITKLITGTYNYDLNYSIYYKTNKNDYKLLKDNLNTQINNYIDFSKLELADDEYITEFKADFGTVPVGFESVINPYIFVRINSDVRNDDIFTNRTRIEGYNKTYMVWDEDEHTTKLYEKEIEVKKLPRTGY